MTPLLKGYNRQLRSGAKRGQSPNGLISAKRGQSPNGPVWTRHPGMRLPAGTEEVMKELEGMTAPAPMTVSPPRMEAPA